MIDDFLDLTKSHGGGWELYLADAQEFVSTLPDGSIDAVLTDPPYEVLDQSIQDWDNMSVVLGMEAGLMRVLKPGATVAVFASWQLWFALMQSWKHLDFRYEVIVHRSNAFSGPYSRRPVNRHEYLLVFERPGGRAYWDESALAGQGDSHYRGARDMSGWNKTCGGFAQGKHYGTVRKPTSVQVMKAKNHFVMAERTGHPTQKEQAFCERWVRAIAPPGALVMDPFSGSGTTGAACIMSGRRFVGSERDQVWFDCASGRLASTSPDPSGEDDRQISFLR